MKVSVGVGCFASLCLLMFGPLLNAQDISNVVVNSILAKSDIVHEEIVIRRTAGDIK